MFNKDFLVVSSYPTLTAGGGCYSALDTFTLFNLHAVSQGICLIVNIVHNIYLHKLQKNNKNSLVYDLSPITNGHDRFTHFYKSLPSGFGGH